MTVNRHWRTWQLCAKATCFRVLLQLGPQPSQIVISLADRPVPFGQPDPEATQFFEAFRPEGSVLHMGRILKMNQHLAVGMLPCCASGANESHFRNFGAKGFPYADGSVILHVGRKDLTPNKKPEQAGVASGPTAIESRRIPCRSTSSSRQFLSPLSPLARRKEETVYVEQPVTQEPVYTGKI